MLRPSEQAIGNRKKKNEIQSTKTYHMPSSLLKATQRAPAWVAQSVERPALDFGSGHELMVCEFEPRIRLCADRAEPAWNFLSLSLSLSLSPPLPHSFKPSLTLAHARSPSK